jgi:hypothetical protein
MGKKGVCLSPQILSILYRRDQSVIVICSGVTLWEGGASLSGAVPK